MKKKAFATRTVRQNPVRGPVNPLTTPIYASSTFELASAAHGATLSNMEQIEEGLSPWLYTRWGNPTTDAAATIITDLEEGFGTHVTPSGMAAITTILLSGLKKGDHIIAPKAVYGGTHSLIQKIILKFGIEATWVDATKVENYSEAINENTKVLLGETPCNPTMTVLDLKEFGELGQEKSLLTIVDSTFGSPYNQQPIKFGIDCVIHSATKYLGGHADIIAGSLTSVDEKLHKETFSTLKLTSGMLSPFDSYLLARGLKTLDVRMERHNSNAFKIAKFLDSHPKVESVHYPGLETHPQHEIAKKQMKGFGGMLSFEVKGGEKGGQNVIENLEIIVLAVSLGGVVSLVEQASTMTHTMVPREERLAGGITDGLLRLSVGLEGPEDLIQDLNNALSLI
ncbi:MAG: trans-sulfuration enzyme family protein [Candidatus Hodarchaeales archaeon]|jgi:methionine-gamma-lyase